MSFLITLTFPRSVLITLRESRYHTMLRSIRIGESRTYKTKTKTRQFISCQERLAIMRPSEWCLDAGQVPEQGRSVKRPAS